MPAPVDAFIAPPSRPPLPLRLALWYVRRKTGENLLPARLLTWYPRAAVGSGVLEALTSHGEGRVTPRMLKMVRMAVSFTTSCPFCMGMNSEGWERHMTASELAAVQDQAPLDSVPSLSALERLAIEYARLGSATPLALSPEFGARLAASFTEREIVILATTTAQVNYWARLIQSLGCPAQG